MSTEKKDSVSSAEVTIRYRINIFLFIIFIISLIFWFHKHLYLYVTETLIIGGTLTLWGAWKFVQSWIKWGLDESKINVLDRKFATEIIVFSSLVLVLLYLTTSSIYFVYEGSSSSDSDFTIEISDSMNKYSEHMTVSSQNQIAGKPFFLRRSEKKLIFSIINPVGYQQLDTIFTPWSNITLKVPNDFKEKKLRIIKILPAANLFFDLAKIWEKPIKKYQIVIIHNNDEYICDDIRRQSIYLGSEERDIRGVMKKRDRQLFRFIFSDYLSGMNLTEQQKGNIIGAWEIHPRIFPTKSFKYEDKIEFKIRKTDPIEYINTRSVSIYKEGPLEIILLEEE